MDEKVKAAKIISKRIDSIMEVGLQGQGRKELIKHLEGGRLTVRQAMLAKCYDCMGFYGDGKVDCQIPACPVYMYMPYRDNPDPRRKSKTMTDEQRKALSEKLQRSKPRP